MQRTRVLPVAIALGSLVLGSAFMEVVTASANEEEAREFVEAMGFAISTPAGLIVLGFIADEFDFDRYFEERGGPGMAGDFLLAVLGGAAVGLVGTAVVTGLTDSSLVLFVVSGFVVFGTAFAVFAARTKAYFDLDPDDE